MVYHGAHISKLWSFRGGLLGGVLGSYMYVPKQRRLDPRDLTVDNFSTLTCEETNHYIIFRKPHKHLLVRRLSAKALSPELGCSDNLALTKVLKNTAKDTTTNSPRGTFFSEH